MRERSDKYTAIDALPPQTRKSADERGSPTLFERHLASAREIPAVSGAIFSRLALERHKERVNLSVARGIKPKHAILKDLKALDSDI
jgi:hypothetical protein